MYILQFNSETKGVDIVNLGGDRVIFGGYFTWEEANNVRKIRELELTHIDVNKSKIQSSQLPDRFDMGNSDRRILTDRERAGTIRGDRRGRGR